MPTSTGMKAAAATRRPAGRRAAVLIMLAVVVLAGVLFAVREFGATRATPGHRVVVVESGDIERTVTALGSLQPKEYVDVGTQVSGQLLKMHVEIGDTVKAGDLIVEIDPKVYEIRLRKDQANLENLVAQQAQQEAELALASQQMERNRRLLESRSVSQDVVDERAAAVKVIEAQLRATRAQTRAAQATIEEDKANLGYTKIYAPMSGTVVSESAVEGQTVNAAQSAPQIVRIANLETMTAWAQVAEADVNRIRPGMSVYFTTLGMPERRWQGSVRQVLPTPEILNDVVLYNVLVDVDNTEALLMTDMTVQVFFVLNAARGVPVAPLAALTPVAGEANQYRARVITPQGIEERVVETGVADRTRIEIVSGLKPGDRLAIPLDDTAGAPAPRARARL